MPPVAAQGVADIHCELPRLVMSPLQLKCQFLGSALMQDQVSNFNKRGIKSDYFCSTRTEKERAAIIRGLQTANIALRLLFVTPETFSSEQ